MHEEEIESLVRKAIEGIDQGDTRVFASAIGELERRGWDQSGIFIMEALLRTTERLPAAGPVAAAELTRRLAERFDGSLRIVRPAMEAVVRDATGEPKAGEGLPRDLAATYALIAIGQLVHEGLLSTDQAIGRLSDDGNGTGSDLAGQYGDETS